MCARQTGLDAAFAGTRNGEGVACSGAIKWLLNRNAFKALEVCFEHVTSASSCHTLEYFSVTFESAFMIFVSKPVLSSVFVPFDLLVEQIVEQELKLGLTAWIRSITAFLYQASPTFLHTIASFIIGSDGVPFLSKLHGCILQGHYMHSNSWPI